MVRDNQRIVILKNKRKKSWIVHNTPQKSITFYSERTSEGDRKLIVYSFPCSIAGSFGMKGMTILPFC